MANQGTSSEARFEFTIPQTGKYEVRLAWVGHENRGTRVPCEIERTGSRTPSLFLNQRNPTAPDELFHPLGQFEFSAGDASITLFNKNATGIIHADAIQITEVR